VLSDSLGLERIFDQELNKDLTTDVPSAGHVIGDHHLLDHFNEVIDVRAQELLLNQRPEAGKDVALSLIAVQVLLDDAH
jgi:hypothetical protein